MHQVREFRYPDSLDQALDTLEKLSPLARVVGGGTSITRRDPDAEVFVDITRLGISYISPSREGLLVGATTTISDLRNDRRVIKFAGGLLARAGKAVGTVPLCNASTIGGRLISSRRHSPLSPALLVLDAVIQITRPGAEVECVSIDDFLANPRFRGLGRSEILTEILLPRAMEKAGTSYQDLARTRTEPAWCQVAVSLKVPRNKIKSARIAVSGVTARAAHFPDIEAMLLGETMSEDRAVQIGSLVASQIQPARDYRAPLAYRSKLTATLVKRALLEAWEQTQEPRKGVN